MKKVNGKFILSNTDKKRIEAHARALARKAAYDGNIEAWFNTETGDIRYCEIVGSGYIQGADHMEYVCEEICRSWN